MKRETPGAIEAGPQLKSSKNRFPLYLSELHLASLGANGENFSPRYLHNPSFFRREARYRGMLSVLGSLQWKVITD